MIFMAQIKEINAKKYTIPSQNIKKDSNNLSYFGSIIITGFYK